MRRLASLLISTVMLAGVACTAAPESTDVSTPTSQTGAPAIRLNRVATLEQPVAMAVRTDDPALYVAEKTGAVVAVRRGVVDRHPVLDLSQEHLPGLRHNRV